MYAFRQATPQDIPTIVHQRRAMFTEMGALERAAVPASVMSAWFAERMGEGAYIGLFAVNGEEVVAGAGLMLHNWLPAPDLTTQRGYICNVYVEPEHRGQGLAKALVRGCLDICQERGISTVTLHASEAGRPVYEKLGFKAGNEMQWRAE